MSAAIETIPSRRKGEPLSEAVRQAALARTKDSAAAIARDLGVCNRTVMRWRKEAEAASLESAEPVVAGEPVIEEPENEDPSDDATAGHVIAKLGDLEVRGSASAVGYLLMLVRP